MRVGTLSFFASPGVYASVKLPTIVSLGEAFKPFDGCRALVDRVHPDCFFVSPGVYAWVACVLDLRVSPVHGASHAELLAECRIPLPTRCLKAKLENR